MYVCMMSLPHSALRYEIREQQESFPPPTETTPETEIPAPTETVEKPPPAEFKPVYLSNSTQPCQCSACVGAVAASIQPVSARQ